ncbi:ATP-binding protein [Metabacillus iocasae]|uniref:histidine kinase n=1 Tax=Priestia iocasae TaxID=2291674 RepID=A0ABS2QUN3_9BACI|nr:ATP-binding protein [Metabacillus iocasae]MBM7703191.1 two-component system sporulation sensor kinase A [Metabacillus iocasae]
MRKETLFEQVFNLSLTPTLVMENDGSVLFVNDALVHLFRLSKEEIKQRNVLIHKELFQIQEEEIEPVRSEEETFVLLKKQSRPYPAHIHIQLLKQNSEFNEPLLLIQWQEYSSNIEKQEEVIRKMKQYKQFVQQSQDAFIVTQHGIIQYMNPAAIQLLGGNKKDEYIGRSFLQFIHPDHFDTVHERMRKIMSGISVRPRAEVQLLTKRGIVTIESSVTKIKFKGNDAIQYIIRDVTDRKKYDEMASKSEKLTMVSKLAAGVAHEIRNPMTAIKGFIQLLKASKEYNEEYHDIMLEELNRVESIIQEFLTLAKPKKETMFEVKSLQKILRHVTLLLATHASYKDCQIVSLLESEDIPVSCEENALKQVFINIIQNGLESMTRGTITVKLEKRGEYGVVTIEDEGSGIDEATLARIGEPFFSTKSSGTGLGLMISYQIIEQHSGHISFSSKLGVGTKVEIAIPYVQEPVNV